MGAYPNTHTQTNSTEEMNNFPFNVYFNSKNTRCEQGPVHTRTHTRFGLFNASSLKTSFFFYSMDKKKDEQKENELRFVYLIYSLSFSIVNSRKLFISTQPTVSTN